MLFTIITEQEKSLPFYIKGIGTQENQEDIMRPSGFPSYQWIYCTQGKGRLTIEGHIYDIEAGTGFYLIPTIGHSYHATQEPWVTHWVMFDGTAIPTLFQMFGLSHYGLFNPESKEVATMNQVMKRFTTLYHLIKAENINKVIDTSGILYEILLEMKNSLITTSVNKTVIDTTRLKPVITYMENHYGRDLSLDELSGTIGVTSPHLCKLFKSTFGISPIHYLIRLRLQNAKEFLLVHPEMRVKDISTKVGYNDTSYFCTIFKKQENVTPKGFRQLHGK